MAALTFKCPDCGAKLLQEIVTGGTQTSTFSGLQADCDDIDYAETRNEGGTVDRYQCANCGLVLRDVDANAITGTEELRIYLELAQA